MAHAPHPAVLAIHDAARAVMHHGEPQAGASLWQRLLPRKRRTLYDEVREFSHALHGLLDVPPSMLSQTDLAVIGTEVNKVVRQAEQEIERNDTSSGEPLEVFATTIYTIRDRYEQIYRRGAARDA